jgi:hypothetical protein
MQIGHVAARLWLGKESFRAAGEKEQSKSHRWKDAIDF